MLTLIIIVLVVLIVYELAKSTVRILEDKPWREEPRPEPEEDEPAKPKKPSLRRIK